MVLGRDVGEDLSSVFWLLAGLRLSPAEPDTPDNRSQNDSGQKKFRNEYIQSINFFRWFNNVNTVLASLRRRY
jgi:hypothetical protein